MSYVSDDDLINPTGDHRTYFGRRLARTNEAVSSEEEAQALLNTVSEALRQKLVAKSGSLRLQAAFVDILVSQIPFLITESRQRCCRRSRGSTCRAKGEESRCGYIFS